MPSALYLDNDLEVEVSLTRRNTSTGATEAAAGVTGLVAIIAASPQGSVIHADLSVNLTERASKAGTYFGLLNGDTLTTRLTGYLNDTVYVVVSNSNKDVELITPYVVRRDRVI